MVVCVCTLAHTVICTHVILNARDQYRVFKSFFSFFKTESFTESKAHEFSYTGWSVSFSYLSSLTPSLLPTITRVTDTSPHSQLLHRKPCLENPKTKQHQKHQEICNLFSKSVTSYYIVR